MPTFGHNSLYYYNLGWIMEFSELKPGISVEGDEIKSLKTDKKQNSYIYLIAGMHGDEVEGVYVLKELQKELEGLDDVTLPILSIPLLNIDGYKKGMRVNSHLVDLNRNFPSKSWSGEFSKDKYNPGSEPLSEPESQYLVKLFKKYPPKLIIAFHSWTPMLNYNGEKALPICEFLSARSGYEIVKDTIPNHPTPGSLGEYASEEFDCPVITYECPTLDDENSLETIWQESRESLIELFKSDLL